MRVGHACGSTARVHMRIWHIRAYEARPSLPRCGKLLLGGPLKGSPERNEGTPPAERAGLNSCELRGRLEER